MLRGVVFFEIDFSLRVFTVDDYSFPLTKYLVVVVIVVVLFIGPIDFLVDVV